MDPMGIYIYNGYIYIIIYIYIQHIPWLVKSHKNPLVSRQKKHQKKEKGPLLQVAKRPRRSRWGAAAPPKNGAFSWLEMVEICIWKIHYIYYIYYVQVILPFYRPIIVFFFNGDTIGSIEDHHLVELKTSEKNWKHITKKIRGSHSLMFEFPWKSMKWHPKKWSSDVTQFPQMTCRLSWATNFLSWFWDVFCIYPPGCQSWQSEIQFEGSFE